LKQDLDYKTDSISKYLKEIGEKGQEIYSLRKTLVNREATIVMNLDRIQKLDELLRVTQIKYDSACLMADESKQQHAELLDYMNNTSIVRSEFNQGRIDLNLSHLNEKLQIENASLKMTNSTLVKEKANLETITKVLRENDLVL
jgi:uncharacterized protein (UPF0276 family)